MTADDVAAIAEYEHDPLGFVRDMFPWGEGSLHDYTGPREWQSTVLGMVGNHLSDPATRFRPLRVAIASGHGIGKSAMVAQLIS